MHQISWLVIVCYSIPECFFVTYLGLQIIKIKPSLLRIGAISLIYGPFVYVIRRLPLPYGFHTLLLTAIIICLVLMLLRLPLLKSTLAIFIGVIVSLSLETLSLPVGTFLLNRTLNQVVQDPYLSLAVSVPKLMVMGLICLYLRRTKESLL